MSLKKILNFHLDRLKTLDPDKDFNPQYFNLAIVILFIGVALGIYYSWFWFILSVLIYSILAYKSVDWNGWNKFKK